jgi:tight adherence protein C
MNALPAVLLLGAIGLGLRRFGPRWMAAGVGVSAGLLWLPIPTLIVVGGFAALLIRKRLANRRVEEASVDANVTLLSELTMLGLNAGLTFSNALALGAEHVAVPLQREVQGILRRSYHSGPAIALGANEGRAAGLYLLAAQAAVTGAPIAIAVQSFVDDRRAEERAAALAAARRLPVRLLFPLALLILPGFMVLTVGPAVLSALERLSS